MACSELRMQNDPSRAAPGNPITHFGCGFFCVVFVFVLMPGRIVALPWPAVVAPAVEPPVWVSSIHERTFEVVGFWGWPADCQAS